MKRFLPFTFVIFLAAGIAYLAFAAEPTSAMAGKHDESKAMMCKDMKHNEMMERKGMMGMCPAHMMMREHVMKKEIIATQDGGVIVIAAGKLYKYDKDINLVKEVEMKCDVDMKEKMGNMREECMEKCQMMKQGEKK
jgi:hypothetical protein